MVYEKSPLGHNEFSSNKRTLNVRERQVLLLVNGQRNLDDLERFFKKEVLADIIQRLASNGYIQLTSTKTIPENNNELDSILPNSLVQPFLEINDNAETICPIKMVKIKNILNEATDDYLGIMGKSIKAQIEVCDNEKDLRQCLSRWHMAMRESKLGRESVSFLMNEINQTLKSS